MPRSQFIDVASGMNYTWEVNAREVPGNVQKRAVEALQPTAAGYANTQPVLIQSEQHHQIERIEGLIANRTQHEAFLNFWRISAERTIHYLPCTGGRFEVVVRSYTPTRKRVVRGPRGARLHVWTYELTMEIVAQVA